MKILQLLVVICLLSLAGYGQCTAVDECNKKLEEAAQTINKLIDVNEAQEKVILARTQEVSTLNDLVKSRDRAILQQEELIKEYRKKSGREFSVLFGLIRIRF